MKNVLFIMFLLAIGVSFANADERAKCVEISSSSNSQSFYCKYKKICYIKTVNNSHLGGSALMLVDCKAGL